MSWLRKAWDERVEILREEIAPLAPVQADWFDRKVNALTQAASCTAYSDYVAEQLDRMRVALVHP